MLLTFTSLYGKFLYISITSQINLNIKDHKTINMFDYLGPKRRKMLDESWVGIFRKHIRQVLPVDLLALHFETGSANGGRTEDGSSPFEVNDVVVFTMGGRNKCVKITKISGDEYHVQRCPAEALLPEFFIDPPIY